MNRRRKKNSCYRYDNTIYQIGKCLYLSAKQPTTKASKAKTIYGLHLENDIGKIEENDDEKSESKKE